MRQPLFVHRLAAVFLVAAILLAIAAFALLTPYHHATPELRQRNDDSVQTIRLVAGATTSLGFLAALTASTAASFQSRPRQSIAIVVLATLAVLAGVLRVFQTIGI